MVRGRKPLFPIWLESFIEAYKCVDVPVSAIAEIYHVPYKNVYRYIQKAIPKYISRKEYLNIKNKRNAREGEKNPNYGGKFVTDDYRRTLSKAMTGKIIPYSVRQKISESKKNGNGKSITDKL